MRNKLLAFVLSAGLAFSGLSYANNNAKTLEQVVKQTQQIQNVSKQKLGQKKEISTSELLKLATLEGNLEFVKRCKNNKPFKEQIKKYGLEKTAEHAAKPRFYCIDLANEYIKAKLNDSNYVIPEEKYLSIARKIGIEKEKFHKGHTNNLAKKVIKAQAKIGEINTQYYIKLIQNKNLYKKQDVTRQYNDLIKSTFTEKEYTEYIDSLGDAMNNYYDALAKTLGWKIIIGGPEIEKIKKTTLSHYYEKRDRLYPKKDQNKKRNKK